MQVEIRIVGGEKFDRRILDYPEEKVGDCVKKVVSS